MNRYIVKNCPCCNHTHWDNGYGEIGKSYLCNLELDEFQCDFECADCTDCLIKRVIEKFNEAQSKSAELDFADFKQYFDEDFTFSILDMFEIKEVEE